jgi:hypothetical protein
MVRNFKHVIVTRGMIGVGFVALLFSSCNAPKNNDLGTFDNPEVALKETQKALSILSKHVNKGFESVQVINDYENTKNKIFNIN